MTQIVEFFEAAGAFDLAPAEALAFFQAKGLKATFAWQDMLGDEHDVAFTVAKMMDTDLLATVQGKLEAAIASGSSLRDFKRDLIPTLQAAGWWGKKDMVDPLTGAVVKAQLGSASRLETIFRTNIQSAYAAGRWEQIDANARAAPWLLYDAVDDFRTRPEHAAMDGTVLPVTDKWWKTHHPPNGWNCRCGVIQLTDAELAEYGLAPKRPPPSPLKKWRNPRTGDTHLIPEDLDPGWDHNPGLARVEKIKALAAEKAAALSDAAQQAALAQAAKLQAEANAAYRAELKAAQAELDAHSADGTPYLANSIKAVQASKAGAELNPKQILELAKEKAAKAEASAWLSTYKKQAAAGTTISAKAQAAFDALPEADKAKILADIEAKSGALAAKTQLEVIEAGVADPYLINAHAALKATGGLDGLTPQAQLAKVIDIADTHASADLNALVTQYPAGTPVGKAINKAVADGGSWDPKVNMALAKQAEQATLAKLAAEASDKLDLIAAGNAPAQAAFQKDYLAKMSAADKAALGPVGTLAKVEEAAAVFKAGKQAAADLHGYKKKILAGKIPTEKEKAAFEALTPEKQGAFLAKIDAEKAKVAPPAAGEPAAAAGAVTIEQKLAALAEQAHAPEDLPQVIGDINGMTPEGKAAMLADLEVGMLDAGMDTPDIEAVYAAFNPNGPAGSLLAAPSAPAFEPTIAPWLAKLVVPDPDPLKAEYLALKNLQHYQQHGEPMSPAAIEALKAGKVFGKPKSMQNAIKTYTPMLEDDGYDVAGLVKLATGKASVGPVPAPPMSLADDYSRKLAAYLKTTGFDQKTIDEVHAQSLANFKAATPDQQKGYLEELNKTLASAAQAVDAPPAPIHPSQVAEPQPLAMANMVKTGNQKGSNTGGFYQDTTTGERYYIKQPASADIARNELLAAKLYEAAGVEVPELTLIEEGGITRLASKIVDGVEQNAAALKAGRVAGVGDNFIVDAWLGNWDVAGMGFDNLLIKGGRAVRVDVGGALRYRAQGGLKGAAWGNTVEEIDSLRNAGINPQTAAVFGKITREDMIAGARKVLKMSDAQIDDLVDRYGPRSAADAAALKATLKARREDIRARFPEADETPRFEPPPVGARVTKAEQREILASRANGYTIRTDKDQIEDHHVVVSTYTDAQGQKRTRVVLKLRPNASSALEASMGIGKGAVISTTDVKAKVLALVKGVNKLAAGKEVLRDKDLIRLAEARDAIDKVLAGPPAGYRIANAAGWDNTRAELLALRKVIDDHLGTAKAGDLAPKLPMIQTTFADEFTLSAEGAAPAQTAITWSRQNGLRYNTATTTKGHMVEDGGTSDVPGVSMAYTGSAEPGETIRYIAQAGENTITSRGYTQIDVPGAGEDATARAFDLLESMGINTARATEQDALELYLERIGHLRTLRNATLRAKWADAQKITDITARLDAKLALINADAGFDIRTSRYWNPTGQRQAFDHGRNTFTRPDIPDAEVDRMLADTIIYHNPTGLNWGANRNMLPRLLNIIDNGGQLASQMDRVRRGIEAAGSSISADHRTGGANYVYTRLATRSQHKVAGVYWKPKQALRLDAVSYSGDRFGEITPEVQASDRAVSVNEILGRRYGAGGSPSNETIFRDSLSMFDDLERIVFPSEADYTKAMKELTKRGYSTWPDGRALADVLDYAGSGRRW